MRTIALFSALVLVLSSPLAARGQIAAVRMIPAPAPFGGDRPVANASAGLPDAPTAAGPLAEGEIASTALPPCGAALQTGLTSEAENAGQDREPCLDSPDTYKRFLDTNAALPLTPRQKGYLALRNLVDPGNLITIFGTSAYTIGAYSHTAYGPGWNGFSKNVAISLLQETTGEFFGTFVIPSLTHEDPHYHRMPHASIPRRVVHAVSRTILAQHDEGSTMPNYASLLTNPICTEISNLYVPGIRGNGPSTAVRILTGYATEPIDNLITEFLPDVARRIHVRVIFVQRILNQVDSDPSSVQ